MSNLEGEKLHHSKFLVRYSIFVVRLAFETLNDEPLNLGLDAGDAAGRADH